MTKEELKTDESKYIIELVIKDKLRKEAEEWLCNNLHSASEEDFIKAMVDIAEPREKQIQIDAEQIRALQKQNGELTDRVQELEAQIEKMSETLLNLLWFEGNLDPYMYECNEAQKGELLKPFTNAREYLKDYICKKCKGEGTVRVGYNGWDKNPCPACKGKGYIFRR